VTPEQKWAAALDIIIALRSPKEVAAAVQVAPVTVERWIKGKTVPSATVWQKLAVEAKLEDQWGELSAARDAVARSAGRPRLPDEELKERSGRRDLGRRKEVRRGKAD